MVKLVNAEICYAELLQCNICDTLKNLTWHQLPSIVQWSCKVNSSFHHLHVGEVTWLMRSQKDLQTRSAVEKNSCCKADS